MIPVYRTLVARIRRELEDLGQVVARSEELLDKVKRSGDTAYLDGVALNLHSFYACLERVFEIIANQCDGSSATGSGWHHALLQQMSAEIKDVRPPVISVKTRDNLEEYLGFRHVVRNVYTFKLDSERIERLVEKLPATYEETKTDLEHFVQFLEELITADEELSDTDQP